MSVRLQRLCEGGYYINVPRLRTFPEIGVKDARSVLKRKFEAVDAMQSILALQDNACKEIHQDKVRTKAKKGRKSSKSAEHRFRYLLRRRMRFTSRKASRCVNDMHQKLSCWLSENYHTVLLPSLQTQEMLRKHLKEVASDATPETALMEDNAAIDKRKMRSLTARALVVGAHFKFKQLLK
ncbi:hypothetical protein PC129_g13274 [Phytophthora cactorum]|uniref:Uncharacterized protein n=1 Tax=Phytophthora cactorum TaxID=29920 RepID=A0A329SB50_9STRA|nr:hypothetical protein PC112_g11409 [Phytophthora cactorum]KAG2859303.1 hypothetical protein PC113_g9056 [Phytophthora cactorum]KAG2902936.1 hypothetical protein PC114_g12492 [Phytophthora cactorum]KAG2936829.1 hypothetical protein PC117_g11951 [Phytophthora cactorum]KAG2986174.1 hypothetical protein PC118_g7927 [Phytophthora cactorum]